MGNTTEILSRLDSLAEQLGTTAEFLFEKLAYGYFVYGATMVGFGVLAIVAIILVARWICRQVETEGKMATVAIAAFISILLLLAVSDGVNKMVGSEGQAANQIVNKLR